MAVHPKDIMTPEQLRDNYEYKVIKKILLREFKWIKDISFKDNEINDYNLIFIDLYINPFELSDETGWAIARWTLNDIEKGEQYYSPYLSSLMKVAYEDAKEITMPIEKTIESVHKSAAIPKELRLPGARKLAIGSFITQEGLTIPTNYVDWRNTIKDNRSDWDRTLDTIEEL